MIHTRVKSVSLAAHGTATVSFGIPPSRFAGAIFVFDPDTITADITSTSPASGQVTSKTGAASGDTDNYTLDEEKLISSPLEFTLVSDSGTPGTATVTVFLNTGSK